MGEEKSLAIRQDFTPQLWDMLKDVGMTMFKSGRMSMVNAEEGAIKAMFCIENGLPLTAARGLYFVNGKLGIESNVIAALLRKHPDYDYRVKVLDSEHCTIEVFRFDELIGEASFNKEHAERAGLWSKNNYQSYPEDMLFAKAIERAQRRFAPDVFMAPVYPAETRDEWDVIEGEVVKAPRRQVPGVDALIKQFGVELCNQAGVFSAKTGKELIEAEDRLAILAAAQQYEKEAQEKADEPVVTVEEIAQEIEDKNHPFANEAN